MTSRVIVLTLALAAGGCVSPTAQEAQTSYASYLGDRSSVELGEMVAAVPEDGPPRNVHVWLSVLVNPRRTVALSDLTDLLDLIRRQEPRIASRVVAAVVADEKVLLRLAVLREELTAIAQRTIEEAVSRWAEHESFTVEAVVTSLEVTDGSVGRTPRPRWGW